MDHEACELSQIGEVALLESGPQQRHSKQSISEWFVVSKNSKVSTFKHKAGDKNRQPRVHGQRRSISSQQLITSWSRKIMEPRNRPGAAGELLPGEYWKHPLLERPEHQDKDVRVPERRSLALAKAESRTGDQVREFPGPLRASVRGART